MTYTVEQCAKLKEWGFPQDKGEFAWYVEIGGLEDTPYRFWREDKAGDTGWEFLCACPSAQEVLEWVAEQYMAKHRLRLWSGVWANVLWDLTGELKMFPNEPKPLKLAAFALVEKMRGK